MASLHQTDGRLEIETAHYRAAVATRGYVSGVAEGSFVDRKSGARDPGFGLAIADFLLEPGSDAPETPPARRYPFHDRYHGEIAKRYVSLPQICTAAGSLPHEIVRGAGYVAVRQWYTWATECPPYRAGARWEQHLLFPDTGRWFLAWDRFAPADRVPNVMMRMDMPGHIRHHGGDVFRRVYLSYIGEIPEHEFHADFAPDARYLYRRDDSHIPRRFIRGYQLESGPWLAGMTLDPASVSEAWCHQRDYVCFIQEFGGRAAKAGEWVGSVNLIGWFDSVAEMERVYDAHRGAKGFRCTPDGWSLI